MEPWEIEWTPETVARFWDLYSRRDDFADRYFSRRCGWSIVDQVARFLDSPVVEIGAGPGYLTSRLLERGFESIALDTSAEAVNMLLSRFGSVPGFLGAHKIVNALPVDNDYAGSVILCETLEHLSNDIASQLLSETRRVLRLGGRVVITTPNAEHLGDAYVICPNCACVFHPVQHMQSFSKTTIRTMMERADFRTVLCRPTYFSQHAGLRARLERVRRFAQSYPKPHLLYIGEKCE
jgi:SAM-dependent methyltransferase